MLLIKGINIVVNIVSVNVCFLILLLFPVNCSYLDLWSFPLGPSVLSSSFPLVSSVLSPILLQRRGEEGASCDLGNLGVGAEHGSTIPKPQQPYLVWVMKG